MARIVKKVICEYCGQEVSASNYSKHLRRHQNHPETFGKTIYHIDHDDLFCKFCGKECKNKKSLVQHEIRCKLNPNKISTTVEGFNSVGREAWNKGLTKDTDKRVAILAKHLSETTKGIPGHLQSEETKLKISKARKQYLSEHPDKVPYIINHSSRISYPEQYFIDLFNAEGIDLKYHLQVSKYELDFYNQDYMVDIEIDGEQHYLDKRIFNSDRERDEYLSNLGWITYRIRWSEYKKLSLNERKRIINDIKLLCPNNSDG